MALIAFLLLATYFASVAAVGYAVFSPFKPIIERKAETRMRYQLTDAFAIFFPIQFGFGALKIFVPNIRWTPTTTAWILISLFLIAAIAWIYGMRLLWRMKIEDWRKRVALLGIVMPIGFVISGIALPFIASAASALECVVKLCIIASFTTVLRFLSLWICNNIANSDHRAGQQT